MTVYCDSQIVIITFFFFVVSSVGERRVVCIHFNTLLFSTQKAVITLRGTPNKHCLLPLLVIIISKRKYDSTFNRNCLLGIYFTTYSYINQALT